MCGYAQAMADDIDSLSVTHNTDPPVPSLSCYNDDKPSVLEANFTQANAPVPVSSRVPTPSSAVSRDDNEVMHSIFSTNTHNPTDKPSTRSSSLEPTDKPSTSSSSLEPTDKSHTLQPTSTAVHDSVIIGAGWSGIRTAQLLSDAGFSVLVLEANDYIGGRAKIINHNTVSGSIPTDLGCEWLCTDIVMESFLSKRDLIGAAAEHVGTHYAGYMQLYTQEVVTDGTAQADLLEDADKSKSRLWGQFPSFKKNLLKALGDMSYAGELHFDDVIL